MFNGPRGFTKRLSGFKNLSYPERLVKAGLCSLELRRLHSDLCLCYQIVKNRTHLNSLFTLDNVGVTRGHSQKLKADRPRLDIRRYFYAYRTVQSWNSLNNKTVCSETLAQFKANLLKNDLSSLLVCF